MGSRLCGPDATFCLFSFFWTCPHPNVLHSADGPRTQVPYTMAKFAVQGETADAAYASMGKTPSELSSSTNLGISLGTGVIAGVAAAIISHPADTLLSKINKAGAGGDGPMMSPVRESGTTSC